MVLTRLISDTNFHFTYLFHSTLHSNSIITLSLMPQFLNEFERRIGTLERLSQELNNREVVDANRMGQEIRYVLVDELSLKQPNT